MKMNCTKIISRIKRGDWDESQEISFDNYPRFEVTLVGERFDGGVPTRIMPALLELQRTIDKSTIEIMGVKRLDAQMLRRTEIVVRVQSGSSSFVADLSPVLNTLVGQMTGIQSLSAILGLGFIFGGTLAFKYYLRHRGEVHKQDLKHGERLKRLDYELELSAEETKRMEIVSSLKQDSPLTEQIFKHQDRVYSTLLNKLEAKDELAIHGTKLVNGAAGRVLARKPKEERVEDRLDGTYIIIDVASGNVSDGYRATVCEVDTGEELRLEIPGGTLTEDQVEQLQEGEWEKAAANADQFTARWQAHKKGDLDSGRVVG